MFLYSVLINSYRCRKKHHNYFTSDLESAPETSESASEPIGESGMYVL